MRKGLMQANTLDNSPSIYSGSGGILNGGHSYKGNRVHFDGEVLLVSIHDGLEVSHICTDVQHAIEEAYHIRRYGGQKHWPRKILQGGEILWENRSRRKTNFQSLAEFAAAHNLNLETME